MLEQNQITVSSFLPRRSYRSYNGTTGFPQRYFNDLKEKPNKEINYSASPNLDSEIILVELITETHEARY
jgi:hypothetical protein